MWKETPGSWDIPPVLFHSVLYRTQNPFTFMIPVAGAVWDVS